MKHGLVALALVCAGACSQPELPRPSLTEAPTHARYSAALSEFGLDKTALGQDWLRAAVSSLADPVAILLPFSETGYLSANEPTAVAYQFDLRRGRRLIIDVAFETVEPTRLFIDLFEVEDDAEPRLVASTAPDERQLDYEARRDVTHVLRVQPELLRGGRFTISERTLASIGFPVKGVTLGSVRSGFGVPRDAGRRSHHGIDIFAPRGTPVLAAVDGRVRTDTGERGGNVIWLSPTDGQRRRLYYAHLDGWAVDNAATVRAGDVIGYVGNTGNARTTPPHLHFGVYDRGPVDPHPFVLADDRPPARISGSVDLVLAWARVTTADAPLRERPSAGSAVRRQLGRGAVVQVLSASGQFYRVRLPDGAWGWLSAGQVMAAGAPMSTTTLASAVPVLDRPVPESAVIETRAAAETIDILGHFADYHLVRLSETRVGWILAGADVP
ncbi:MAG TPA: M23 family metallopeptidase [Vicinamibacterales bacterium]|nr:M23 family metallopeptidase [Vicinamibacterales bacterium]